MTSRSNVRELRNLIERGCILSTGDEIAAEHFPVAGNVRAQGRVAAASGDALVPDDLAAMMP
jgi:DNA-binding NtrC family response regulator